ncbi:Ig-like domain-containing protein [Flavobacterium sp. H4147]|uniref:Ig-like domain-containing protein n=1 Tax=Flavobacterium sp. H4147 TaxID=3034149 RepID=UPI0023EE281D|nr:Ig-like domain-containing protein [Flavobacterium sp. H4147]
MIKNYFNLYSGSNLQKAIALFFVFFACSQFLNAQCAIPITGCSGTNLSNFGADSNNDASSIEYDNFVSSFHSTIVRTSDGSLQVWGERMANNGTSNVLSPRVINRTNYPALSASATPLKAALGSSSANNTQGILLATDGLYAWSTEGAVLHADITSSTSFQKITIGGNTNGLPSGVVPGDVKMMFATYGTLAITTCSGDVWVISQTASVRGNGSAGDALNWYKVTTADTGNPDLTGVVACRGNYNGLMALKSDGTVYVWGNNVLLGNNTAIIASQNRAVQMTLPASITPKMIGSTGNLTERSYYVLATDGNLYALGENSGRQLGNWATADRLSWVQPKYTSANGTEMNNIKWISVQEHDTEYGAVNVINSNYNLYAFGQNDYNLLGTSANPANPIMPSGISASDRILAVETGGHTSMIVKSCETKFGYAGHRIRGSMGDGTNDTTQEATYTFATADVQICGAESNPVIQPISTGGGPDSKYCIDDPVLLNPTPAGGTLTLVSGPGTLSGNTLTFTGAGIVSVQYSVTTSCGGTIVTTRNFEGAVCPADLEVTKTVNNATPSIGNDVLFTVTAKNNGPYKATGITVTDVLPSGYTLVSAVPSSGTWSEPDWTVGSLANGASSTLAVTATVNPTGSYANTATISGNNPDNTTANNSATATPLIQTNLSVTKNISNTTPNVGSMVTFTITASNAGPSAATGVKVTDVLPSGYTFVSATPSTGTWAGTEWTIGNLAIGASTTLTMEAIINATGSYVNTASISGEQDDPTQGNNSGTVTPVINQPPSANSAVNAPIASSAGVSAVNALTASDTDGTIASFTIVSLPLHGTLALNGTPVSAGQVLSPLEASQLTYDPAGDFTGDDTFTFTALDNLNAVSNTAVITIPVGNNAPSADSAVNAPIASAAGASAVNALTASDTDGTIVSYTVVSLPLHGILALNGTPVSAGQLLSTLEASQLTYDPAGDFTGDDTFTFTALDNLNAVSNTAVITIPVGNNAPSADSAVNAPIASAAGASAVNALTASDTDGTIVSFTIVSLPLHGTLALNGTPVSAGQVLSPLEASQLTYDPAGHFTGDDTFTFTALDNLNAVSNTAVITIPVGNNAPSADSAVNAPIASSAGASAVNALTASDTDGTIASFTIVSLPLHGTLALNGTPVSAGQVLSPLEASQLTYDPAGDFTGDDTFTFTALDNLNAVSNTAVITIPVGNNAPSADSAVNAPIASSAGASSVNALTASDTDGTIASFTITALPLHGTLALNGTPVSAGQVLSPLEASQLTYDPAGDFTGDDTFTFTALDNLNAVSNTAVVTIPVGNNAPSADSAVNAPIASSAGASSVNALTASDTDGTIVSFTITALPLHGTLALNGTPVSAGQVLSPLEASQLTYDPAGDFTGDDTFTFTALDNLNAVSNTAVITIPVGNNAPSADSAVNAPIASSAGASAVNALTASDTDGTIASFTIVSLPLHGTLALNGTPVSAGQVLSPLEASQLTYDPAGDFTGDDTFTFTALDNLNAVSNTAVITIPVGNNAPSADSAVNAPIASSAGASAVNALTASDTDGTIASFTIVSLPLHGTLALNGTPVSAGQVLSPLEASQLTYDPAGDFTGDDTFTFTALDNLNAVSNTAVITIPVGNNAPSADSAVNAPIASSAGASAVNALTASDTDGTIVSFTIVSLPLHGILALNGTPVSAGQVLSPLEASQLTYDPAGDFTGDDTFTFTALDNLNAVSNTAVITIPVGNNAPVANNDTNSPVLASAGATAVNALTATDTDGTIVSFTITALPVHGTLALNGIAVIAGQVLSTLEASQLTYDPAGDFTGDDSFTFTALDNLNAVSNTAVITIPVGNNAPSADSAVNAPIASSAGVSSVNALTASDTDGTIVSYTVVSLPLHGILALNGTPVSAGQVLSPLEASQLTYDPAGDFTGDDSFTFTALDNLNAVSNTAVVTIPVGNNAPSADSAVNAPIASSAGASAVNTLTASDTDGTIVSYTVVSLPLHGILALNGTPVSAGQVLSPLEASQLTYDPAGDFTGDDTFTFTALDNLNAVSNTAVITIPVGNNAPSADSAVNAPIASSAGASALNALTASDTDGTIASFTITALPVHGTLALNGTPVSAGQVLSPLEASQLTYDPAGDFTGDDSFTFTALDNLNAVSNTAVITIPVGNNAPVANNDTNSPVLASAGPTAVNALTATDTDGTIVSFTIVTLPVHGTLALNGIAVIAGQVLSPLEAGQLTYDPNGTFSGNDSFTFTATDNNGAVDTTPAVVIIPIEKRNLTAVRDEIGTVVGINEQLELINVFDNDTVDNNPLTPNEVNLTIITPDPSNVLTLQPDGTAVLIPNAPAGTYTLTYEICEKTNAANCATATVTVTVVAPVMSIEAESYCSDNTPYVRYSVKAENFAPSGLLTIRWIDSANRVVATQTDMPLNGTVLWPGAVVDAGNKPTDWPGWIFQNGQWQQGNDGFELTRPSVTMQFTLNPTQSVTVNYPLASAGCNASPVFGIEAVNEDDTVAADGINGSLEVINVLDNDTLNGFPVNGQDVILTAQNFPQGITLNPDGTIDVAPGTAGGDHNLTYQICEKANPNNCSSATVHLFVEVPAVALIMEVKVNDENGNGNVEAGETLTYTFVVKNTGNVPLSNIQISDLLPGVIITGGPITLAVGQSDTSTFTGTYTLTQADINAGSVTNQASVSGLSPLGVTTSDTSDSKELNGNNPTVIELDGCSIKIYNAVSLNGDGMNERFYIRGIECYPDNTVQIFNRWGVLVFEREHYNNNDIVFKGYSEGRTTVKGSEGLPEGTYYYILRYKSDTAKTKQEAGYLYLTK